MAALAEADTAPPSLRGRMRIVWRLNAMLLLLIACVPLYYLWRAFGRHNPWPRRFLAGVNRLAGVKLTVLGKLPQGKAFLIANHVSWIDIPAISAATGSAFVGHDGLASTPLLKTLCAMNDTVFIARHQRHTVHSQVEQVRTALADTGALTIFPEGTTSDGTGLLAFKSSLLSALEPVPAGVSVIPVLLEYGPEAAHLAWVGEEHGLANFLRILARKQSVELTVHFLPALTGEQVKDRKTMASAAREAMLGLLS